MQASIISLSIMQDVEAEAAELSEEQLCQILQHHLHIDARPNFAAAAAAGQQKLTTAPVQASQTSFTHHKFLPLC